MPTTPRYAIPYPLGTDRVMDGDNVMQAIAERVEAILAPVDDRSLAAPSGFRNVLRNGDMGVQQRTTLPALGASGVYTVDGWLGWVQGAAMTHNVGNLGVTLLPWRRYLAAAMTTPASAAGDYAFTSHRIEDVRTLSGQVVTLSFLAGTTVVGRALGVAVRQAFGTGGSPSAVVDTAVSAVVIGSAGLTRYTVTFTVPSIAAKTIGTNEDSYLELRLWMGTGATNQPSSGLSVAQGTQGAWTLNLTGVQLEAGPTATPFERLPAQQQLAWCQRYFWRMGAGAVSGSNAFGSGFASGTTSGLIWVNYPVQMRAIPTNPGGQAAGWMTYSGPGQTLGLSAISIYVAGLTSANLGVSLASAGWGAGGALQLAQNLASAVFDFTAEL